MKEKAIVGQEDLQEYVWFISNWAKCSEGETKGMASKINESYKHDAEVHWTSDFDQIYMTFRQRRDGDHEALWTVLWDVAMMMMMIKIRSTITALQGMGR